jgi:hypothetical protein
MQQYLIQFDEPQRIALLHLFQTVDFDSVPETHPLYLWVSMLEELPTIEQGTINNLTINNFCDEL